MSLDSAETPTERSSQPQESKSNCTKFGEPQNCPNYPNCPDYPDCSNPIENEDDVDQGTCAVGDNCSAADCIDCSAIDCGDCNACGDCDGCGNCGDCDGCGGCDPCFIATAVYGDTNAPQVVRLRRFRDERLIPSPSGHRLVNIYYRFSPPVAQYLRKKPRYAALVRSFLDQLVSWLDRR